MHRLVAVLLILFPIALVGLIACSPAVEPRGSATAPRVDERVAIGFAAARTALELADAAEFAYLRDGNERRIWQGESDPRLLASAARVEKLKALRSVLEQVRQRLAEAGPRDLQAVLIDLEVAVAAAQQAGVKVPEQAVQSLHLLQEVLQ